MSEISPLNLRVRDQRRIADLESEVAKLEQKIAAIRVCLKERRLGDALALTLPTKITPPQTSPESIDGARA